MGPGIYYRETSLLKPSFNVLAKDRHVGNKASNTHTDHSYKNAIDCDRSGRSSLQERRELNLSLRDLLVKSHSLSADYTQQQALHGSEMSAQTELRKKSESREITKKKTEKSVCS